MMKNIWEWERMPLDKKFDNMFKIIMIDLSVCLWNEVY
jgi:hypothetical protein